MDVNAALTRSQDSSSIRLYRRLIFWQDQNKSIGAQVATINDKLYVGLGKFWRLDGWKENRWAPGKKGSHIFLTLEQFQALVSTTPKVLSLAKFVKDLSAVAEYEFEDISDTGATIASVRSGTSVSGTEPTCLAVTAVGESTPAVCAVDSCDGELQELGEPNASEDEVKKTQDAPSTTSKRKRGRPAKASVQESATPKTKQAKSRKVKSNSAKPDGDRAGNPVPVAANNIDKPAESSAQDEGVDVSGN